MARLSFAERLRGEERWWVTIGDHLAHAVSENAGRMSVILIHTAVFITYLVSGVDHYPFNFLTLLLSLEAIYLTLFVLMGQRLQGERDRAEVEEDRERNRMQLEAVLASQKALSEVIAAIRHGMAEQDEILVEIHDAVDSVDDGRDEAGS